MANCSTKIKLYPYKFDNASKTNLYMFYYIK